MCGCSQVSCMFDNLLIVIGQFCCFDRNRFFSIYFLNRHPLASCIDVSIVFTIKLTANFMTYKIHICKILKKLIINSLAEFSDF